jgi:hypothetical protein
VGDRLGFHATNEKGSASKGFWSETIVLVSKDENLTKSHARYVEARLIAEAARNPRWTLKNAQRAGEEGKLPLPDRAAMEEFVDQTITLVGALGCDLFRAVRGSPNGEMEPEENPAAVAANVTFFFRGAGFAAEMVVSPSGEFVVRQGSRARVQTTATIPRGTASLRKTLIEKGVLREDESTFVFSSDFVFPSVSSAAAAIYGGSANGRILWKLPDGRTYAAWEADENAGPDDVKGAQTVVSD